MRLPLVRNRNLGPILHHFGDMTAFMCSWPHLYSIAMLGVFQLHQIAHVGVSQRISLKLFCREIIFEEFQPIIIIIIIRDIHSAPIHTGCT